MALTGSSLQGAPTMHDHMANSCGWWFSLVTCSRVAAACRVPDNSAAPAGGQGAGVRGQHRACGRATSSGRGRRRPGGEHSPAHRLHVHVLGAGHASPAQIADSDTAAEGSLHHCAGGRPAGGVHERGAAGGGAGQAHQPRAAGPGGGRAGRCCRVSRGASQQ